MDCGFYTYDQPGWSCVRLFNWNHNKPKKKSQTGRCFKVREKRKKRFNWKHNKKNCIFKIRPKNMCLVGLNDIKKSDSKSIKCLMLAESAWCQLVCPLCVSRASSSCSTRNSHAGEPMFDSRSRNIVSTCHQGSTPSVDGLICINGPRKFQVNMIMISWSWDHVGGWASERVSDFGRVHMTESSQCFFC